MNGFGNDDPAPGSPLPAQDRTVPAPGVGADGGSGDTTGLGATAVRGAFASMSGQLFRGLVQLLSVVILVRLLSPQDYGLVAMTGVVIGVGEIFRDFGLSTAAVQARHLSHQQRSNLFWINTAIGAGLAMAAFAAAPALAALFRQPELVPVLRVLCLVFLANGAATQYRASLERSLQFTRTAWVDAVSPALGLAVAVVVALLGHGVWALVAQQLVAAFTMLVMLGMMRPRWWPSRYRRGTDMDGMIRFGGNMVGTQLIGYVANNTDTFIIGYRLGATPLGLYNRTFQLLMQPYNMVRVPLTRVALPVLSRLHDEPRRYSHYVVVGQLALGYTVALGLALVAGAARPVVWTLLGAPWVATAPLLMCLAIAAAFQTLSLVAYWVYVTKGLTGYLVRYSMISAAIKVTCILVGSQFGLVGVAVGYAVAPILSWPISFWWLSRRAVLPLRDLYWGAGRIVVVALAAGLTSRLVCDLLIDVAQIVPLLIGPLAGIIVAAVLVVVIPPFRADLRTLVAMGALLRRHRSQVSA